METKICKACNVQKKINSFKPFTKKDGSIGSLVNCGGCRHRQGKKRKNQGVSLKHTPYFDELKEQWFKVCSKCSITKNTTDFHKNKAVKAGINSICKICQKLTDKVKYERQTPQDRRILYAKRRADGWIHFKNSYWRNPERARKYAREMARKPTYRARVNERLRNLTPERKAINRENNRENSRKHRMVRRARERNCSVIIPFTRADIIKRNGLNCYLCGKLTTEKECHIEHILPISRGGNHKPENVKVACAFCNQSKGNKTLTEYKKRRGDYDRFRH